MLINNSLGKVVWTLAIACFCSFGFVATAFAQLPPEDAELALDYSQWKLASGSGQLAQPVSIAAKPGFAVELVRAAAPGEGSWISLAFDSQGSLLIGREDKGIWRLKLNSQGEPADKLEAINDTLLEPRGLLLAHHSLYVTANNAKGLYRLQETADGNYGPPELLQAFEGGVGHGRNGLALGPDGRIYLACGNNVKIPADWNLAQSPYRNFAQDRLLPCEWNEFLFDGDVKPPCGFVARCTADGKDWQVVAGGFRNPYDLAFNAEGELFTYDADMEWDVGAPWYRPTTVMHVIPGGEYGWRQGTSVWPNHFPDALPRVVDVGLGSPTGVAFGERSNFPPPYRQALFILDWAYGRILAVHLTPNGSSYTGKLETFLKGKPLNVTDVVFGPDGAMYFTVGGRGTRAALYRVKWTGVALPGEQPPLDKSGSELRLQRKALEPLLTNPLDAASPALSAGLASADAAIRHTARIALENSSGLPGLKLTAGNERDDHRNSLAQLTANLGRVRLLGQNSATKPPVDWEALLQEPQDQTASVLSLRTIQLALIRGEKLSAEQTQQLQQQLASRFPAKTWPENQLLAELLVFLQSPQAVAGSLALVPQAENDQQRLFYLYTLRQARTGWSLDHHRAYLKWLKASESFAGAHYLPRFLTYIRSDALETFTADERTALAAEIDALGRYPDALATPPRPEIKQWTLAELAAEVAQLTRPADRERGKRLYAQAQCIRCHRHGDQGIPFGPDLHQVSARFGTAEILEAIVTPSKVIDDKFRTLVLETSDGQIATGFLVGGNAETLFLAADPLRPTIFVRVPRATTTRREQSPLSPMPAGLLNGLTADEVYDLLGYLGAVGKN